MRRPSPPRAVEPMMMMMMKIMMMKNNIKVKVKQAHHRPEQTQRVPGN